MEELRYKLNQLFILGFDGINPPNVLINKLANGLGGVIFFTQNIQSKEQTLDSVNIIKKSSKIPPFICIDEEGGRVERTENIFGGKHFLSAKFACKNGEKFVKEQTKQIAVLLKSMGFNLNFSPVLDVNTNINNPIIGERAFSNITDDVITFGNIVVKEYIANGIIPCTKHFPGHGDAQTDSHLSLPEIDLNLDDFEKNHIRAFKEVQSPMVMVAHLYCKCFDTDRIPSSISKNILAYLKKTLSYNPLIITDDMVMGGIVQINNPVDNVVSAIKNGVNLILYRGCDNSTLNIIDSVFEKSKTDAVLQENIKLSYEKIISFKNKWGI
jgi:beta-N-acetylhexosaminidase